MTSNADFFIKNKIRELSSNGYSISIVNKSDIIFESYRGATISGDSINRDSIFRIGSITKTMTALSVLKLIDMRILNLDDLMVDHLPELKNASKFKDIDQIKIVDLLTHTSGMPRRAKGNDFEVSIEKLIKLTRSSEQLFKTGRSYSYSNLGYALIGEIISRTSKMPYEEFIRKYILSPLRMENTYFHRKDIPLDTMRDFVLGHSADGSYAYHPDLKGHAAGWGMFSTTKDLGYFLNYVLGDNEKKIVSDVSFKMWKKSLFNISKDKERSIGWFVSMEREGKVLGHGGRIDGFEVEVKAYLDKKIGFIVLANKFKNPVTDFIDKFSKFVVHSKGELLEKSNDKCYFYLDKTTLPVEVCLN